MQQINSPDENCYLKSKNMNRRRSIPNIEIWKGLVDKGMHKWVEPEDSL